MNNGRGVRCVVANVAWMTLGASLCLTMWFTSGHEVMNGRVPIGYRVALVVREIDTTAQSVSSVHDTSIRELGRTPLYVLTSESSGWLPACAGAPYLVVGRVEETRTGRRIVRAELALALNEPGTWSSRFAKLNLDWKTFPRTIVEFGLAAAYAVVELARLGTAVRMGYSGTWVLLIAAKVLVLFGAKILRIATALLTGVVAGIVAWKIMWIAAGAFDVEGNAHTRYAMVAASSLLFLSLSWRPSIIGSLLTRLVFAGVAAVSAGILLPATPISPTACIAGACVALMSPAAAVCLASTALATWALDLGFVATVSALLAACSAIHLRARGRWFAAQPCTRPPMVSKTESRCSKLFSYLNVMRT